MELGKMDSCSEWCCIFVQSFIVPSFNGCTIMKNFFQYTDLAKQLVSLRGSANYTSGNNDCTPLMEACSAGIAPFYILLFVVNY